MKSKATVFAVICLSVIGVTNSANALNYTLTDLGIPPGNQENASFAYGINDAGQVVGLSVAESGGGAVSEYATEWSGGTAMKLGALSNSSGGVAFAINNAGTAVGYAGLIGGGEVATQWTFLSPVTRDGYFQTQHPLMTGER